MMYIVQGLGHKYTSFTILFNTRETTPNFNAFCSYLEWFDRMMAHQNNMDVNHSFHANTTWANVTVSELIPYLSNEGVILGNSDKLSISRVGNEVSHLTDSCSLTLKYFFICSTSNHKLAFSS